MHHNPVTYQELPETWLQGSIALGAHDVGTMVPHHAKDLAGQTRWVEEHHRAEGTRATGSRPWEQRRSTAVGWSRPAWSCSYGSCSSWPEGCWGRVCERAVGHLV
jgi:hypothetical protein